MCYSNTIIQSRVKNVAHDRQEFQIEWRHSDGVKEAVMLLVAGEPVEADVSEYASTATGYYVYRSTSKNGTYTKIATIKSGSTVKYTNKTSGTYKVVNGATYTYYVVPYYKSSSGTVTKGSYSNTKKIVYLTAGKVSSVKNSSLSTHQVQVSALRFGWC